MCSKRAGITIFFSYRQIKSMLLGSSCLAYAPDRRLSGCRALHSRRLPSAPRLQSATARFSSKPLDDAADRKPRIASSAFFSGRRETSKQDEGSQQLTDPSGEEEEAVPEVEDEQQHTAAARLWDLAPKAFGFLGFLGLFIYIAFYVDSALKIPALSVMCFITCAFIWSAILSARATVAVKAPLPIVRFLTAVHALDLDAVFGSDSPQYTALTVACMTGNNERIRGLLSLGAGPDVTSKDLPRPLLIACCEADAEAAEDLLRAGANPEALPGEINSPLEVAATQGHVEVVGALLRGGANPMAVSQGSKGRTLIGIMCGGLGSDLPGPVRAEIVDLLLQAGADPRVGGAGAPPGESSRTGSVAMNTLNGDGGGRQTAGGGPRPIELAVYNGIAEVIPLLVAAGEDPGRAPAGGMSFEEYQAGAIPPLLIMAAMKGHVGVVQALVTAGADMEVTLGGTQGRQEGRAGGGWGGGFGFGDGEWRIGDGLTPLCVAVQQGHVGIVRVLVEAGADTQVHGTTLMQMARYKGFFEIEEVLLAAGAAWN